MNRKTRKRRAQQIEVKPIKAKSFNELSPEEQKAISSERAKKAWAKRKAEQGA